MEDRAYEADASDTFTWDHGGQRSAAARWFGLSPDRLTDFSANINPLGVPPEVQRALRAHLGAVTHYPDSTGEALCRRLADRHGLEAEHMLLGNGSVQLIYLIARALHLGRALIPVPTFSEYERALAVCGGAVVRYLLHEERGFRLHASHIRRQLHGIDSLSVCNPNNPTGRMLPKRELLQLARDCEEQGIWLVVDEAFMDFVEGGEGLSMVQEVRTFSHLVVLRSFTKIYAFPGLRLGYLVAHPSLIERIRFVQEPWSVNTLALVAGETALRCQGFVETTRRMVRSERRRLYRALCGVSGIRSFPSVANFLLCKLTRPGVNATMVWQYLGELGMLIRKGAPFRGLDDRFFRIAVRTRWENERLIRALREVMADER